jgi:hypothetical protein
MRNGGERIMDRHGWLEANLRYSQTSPLFGNERFAEGKACDHFQFGHQILSHRLLKPVTVQ